MRRGVLCGGSIMVDVNKTIDRWPEEDGIAFIEGETSDSGGPGFNLAVDLARLGAPFPIDVVGVLGDDVHGLLVREVCRAAGLGAAGLTTLPGLRTSHTDVMIVKEDGRRTFFHDPGANAVLAPEHFDLARSAARILHLGAPGIHATMDRERPGGNGWAEVLSRGRAAGMWTNLELVTLVPERQRTLALPCLPHLDSVVVNELEAGALAGIDTHRDGAPDLDRAEAAARRLLELGVRELAVVHFPTGAVAAARGGRAFRQGSVRVPPAEVKSTNGAGDAFASGVVLGLHEGWPVERCLEAGVCVAAVSLGAFSTSGAIRPIEECLAYGRAHGFRGTGGPGSS
ncbi:MAG TPA: carbohydrate kinase family protein [Anaeromyxobacter sp.]|nr:carbohydrate kinase family protein [Anaeromyxobacter sp.]